MAGNRRRWRAAAALLLAMGVGLLAGCAGSPDSNGPPATIHSTDTNRGFDETEYLAIPGDPISPPSGELNRTDGTTWTYTEAKPGRLTLIYYGYTSCPDVCPTTMADLAKGIRDAGAKDVDVIMVSSDPTRDTLAQLTSWLGGFDPTFTGARGPIDQVVKQAAHYGIPIEQPTTTDGNYQVTHGARVIVLTGGGDAVGYIQEGVPAAAITKLLPKLTDTYLR